MAKPSCTSAKSTCAGLSLTAEQADTQAKVTPAQVDFAEVHDCFTITEILNYEDLGFCPRGQGGRFVEEGRADLGGEKPVNPSGGLKAYGHPVGATGVRMIYELTTQLRGQAGARQVQGEKIMRTQPGRPGRDLVRVDPDQSGVRGCE